MPAGADGAEPPRTRYARSGDAHIAYQVFGDGPIDVVLVPGFVSNIEHIWQLPNLPEILKRTAGFSRVIMFDKRGTGLSDPVVGVPTLEERIDARWRSNGARARCSRCSPRPTPRSPQPVRCGAATSAPEPARRWPGACSRPWRTSTSATSCRP